MWAGVDFVRNPRVYLAILVKDSLRTDQASRIKNMTWPLRSDFEHRAALNVDVVFVCFLFQAIGVFIRNLNRQFLDQFGRGFKDRRRMSKLWKHYQPHRQKRRRTGQRRIDH